MSKHIPFKQFKEPLPTRMANQKEFKRFITINHLHKEIYIQIMWDGYGELKVWEYLEVKAGNWYKYIPDHLISNYRQFINSGYQVLPVVFVGDQLELHICCQIIELTDTHHIDNQFIKPISS